MEKTILKFVLLNAHQFAGKVNAKAVLGQVLRENPECKKNVADVLIQIQKKAEALQGIEAKEIEQKLRDLAPELLIKKKVLAGPLKPLAHAVEGKVVLRIAPSPSGALHVGHAYGAAVNAGYADMYHGRCILRIEDTNPENIYPAAYELIRRDAQWLSGERILEVVEQSSRLGTYYDYSEKLVNMGKAYVCTCPVDAWREMKNKGVACDCRSLPLKEQQLRYAKMFTSYAEGEAVLRLKTDIADKNPAMRDFGLMRVNEHIHPKTGKEQRVWPLMVFSVAIDDHEHGVTHVLNGKDHADNAKKETMIMTCFDWEPPIYKHWGRINFVGLQLSTSKTRLKIEQQEFHGWDDIRLPFLPALRKRGYQPQAFRKFGITIGLSLSDKTVTQEEFWKMLNAFNKEIVEPTANRYFFVANPKEITIEDAPKVDVVLPLHPDFKDRGSRKLTTSTKFIVAQQDYENLGEKKIHRLIDYGNFEVSKTFNFVSLPYEEYKNNTKRGNIIHWLPQGQGVPVLIQKPDGSQVKGTGEPAIAELLPGTIVQFERQYFATYQGKEDDTHVFWYLHT